MTEIIAGYSPEEYRSIWEIGQGCAGVAWESERTQYAPEDEELPVSVEDAEARSRPWNMTDPQIRMTAGTIASRTSKSASTKSVRQALSRSAKRAARSSG